MQEGPSYDLPYTAPYDFEQLLGFFRSRQIEGVERIGEDTYERVARIEQAGQCYSGWIRVTDDKERSSLILTLSASLEPVSDEIIIRCTHQFDTASDPETIHAGLAALDDIVPGSRVIGTRLPGCFDRFETSARAILGQQVTVTFANTLAGRIAAAFGTPVDTGIEGLVYAFPNPQEIAAIENIADVFGDLGVIKTRSRCIRAIAEGLVAGEIDYSYQADALEQIEKLLSIKGIGPWSAGYMAMRVFSYPDAFLETDAGIKHALPQYSPKERLALVEACRPWRSYANISLWNSLG